jgi:ectoine hydroxylase-related dioxygenase (phytanoyl-CoA dioxygenase family)
MKSAYELAMERLGTAPVAKLTDEQKKQLAEIDARYKAKIAEREIFLNGQIEKAISANDDEGAAMIRRQLASERKTLAAELEEKKEAVRKTAG